MRDYLFGKSIPETPETIDFIDKVINKNLGVNADTTLLFGISNPNNSSSTVFLFDKDSITDKPLPTTAAPTKSEPKKRGRKPKSELPEIDLGGLEDIGDIDIDAIDFDNLVI
jgi:hypothetical protein